MNILYTNTLSNQNIAAYLEVGSYTAVADCQVMIRVVLDQVQGNGDYYAYATIAAAVFGPITKFAVPNAVTKIGFVAGVQVPLLMGEVLKVYVKGLSTDTTTPDIVTKVFDLAFSVAGDAMSLVMGAIQVNQIGRDALRGNQFEASAIAAIQAGLSTLTQADILSDATPFAGANIANLDAPISDCAVSGDQMNLVDVPNPTAITAIQAGLPTDALTTDEFLEAQLDRDYEQGSIGWVLGLLRSGRVEIDNPVRDDGMVLAMCGDSYTNTHGNAMTFPDANNSWPSLEGGVVLSLIVDHSFETTAGTVVVGTGAGKVVRFDVTAEETESVLAARPYRIKALLPPDDAPTTLRYGIWKPIAAPEV